MTQACVPGTRFPSASAAGGAAESRGETGQGLRSCRKGSLESELLLGWRDRLSELLHHRIGSRRIHHPPEKLESLRQCQVHHAPEVIAAMDDVVLVLHPMIQQDPMKVFDRSR